MIRRKFITLLGSAAAVWPLAARAQSVSMRRVIVLMGTADDAEAKDRAVALQEGLQKLRWTVGRDLQINYLFAAGSAERLLAYANEAVASKPDILLAQTNPAVKALQNVTRTLPIVFLQVSDPVGAGFVGSLAHPGDNITGFTNFEAEIGGKWLQRLKDIAPAVENVGFVFNPETSAHTEFVRAAEKASGALDVKIVLSARR
jgi:putative ABC transport system substrate-binding protein